MTNLEPSKSEIDTYLAESERIRTIFRDHPCPSCGEKRLKLATYVKNVKWSCTFICMNCLTAGKIDALGIEVEFAEKQSPSSEPVKKKEKPKP